MAQRILVLLAETPVHAGGGEATGIVDLPIQREAATRLPIIWGQSLKGALRDTLRSQLDPGEDIRIFGSPVAAGSDGAGDRATTRGGVAFGDARLLLLPVPTLVRTFAWVTAPLLLSRLGRIATVLSGTSTGWALTTPPGSTAIAGETWSGQQALGSLVQTVRPDRALAGIAADLAELVFPAGAAFDHARAKLREDVLVVDDGVLAELSETGTDIVARVQLNAAKTVENGPFYSEHLPCDTALAALLSGEDELLARLGELLDGTTVRVGGDETIGKGLMWCRVHDAATLPRRSAAAAHLPAAPAPVPATPAAATTPEPARRPGGAGPSPASIPRRGTR
ncbi:type III-B CRISPR module RAMP protein Cmr4 [Amycolatopsis sp. CA-128772]|uniref:type III-B CRISPR module RAMP protein Cmr4 n=1 Tax=Amycolatopsis sp. CA-128772 TaxID=2073159 RepID=UPI001304B14C|nr:type III-B CRISPR module RAMP protein Cmr4 [Amycolatopsis sp. CA-128772]